MAISRALRRRLVIAAAVVLVLVAIYGALSWSGTLMYLLDGDAMRAYVVRLGWLGPVAVVAMMSVAIVLSPIPSAPIAMAAGAVYGQMWGGSTWGSGPK